jgi:hypothetical protein
MLQVVEGGRAGDTHGAEMADIEDHGGRTAGPVFGDGPLRVGQRHLPPAEGHHLRSQGDMGRIQR